MTNHPHATSRRGNSAASRISFPLVAVVVAAFFAISTSILAAHFGSFRLLVVLDGGIATAMVVLGSRRAARCVADTRDYGTLLVPVAGLVLLVAVIWPGICLALGWTTSKLRWSGILIGFTERDYLLAVLQLSAGIIAFALGAYLATLPRGRSPAKGEDRQSAEDMSRLRGGHTVLLAMGVLGALLRGWEVPLTERGHATGQGLTVALGWALCLAVVLAIIYNHFGSRWRLLTSLLAVAYLVAGGSRSPLIPIAIALALKLYGHRSHSTTVRRLILTGAAAGISILLLVGISDWRGAAIRGERAYFWASFVNPVRTGELPVKLAESGFDSVDGFILARAAVADSGHFSPVDPLKAVVNLVPHAIFPGKPAWLGGIVTERYLGWRHGGIFMSGPGYVMLLSGSLAIAVLVMGLLGVLLARLARCARSSQPAIVLILYFALRFLAGGDAFDVFHALMLSAVLVVGLWIGGRLPTLRREG